MAVKDLVSGVLAESITTSTTNVLVTIAQSIGASGIQAFFPTPPFYITIMPKSPIVGVAELCWDARIGFRTTNVDSLVAKMHEMSLAYVVGDMATYCPFGEPPYLTIYLQPSTDGQTNIDVGFMEELAKLTIIPLERKDKGND